MTTTPLTVAVLGAGSIGCYLGGLLAHSGVNVTLIGRQRYKDQVDTNGLTLTHYARDVITLPPDQIVFSTDPAMLSGHDVILLCVKSQDTDDAAQILKTYARPGAVIISCQNGIGNVDCLRTVLQSHPCLNAVVPFNVTPTAMATFHCGTEGDLQIEAHGSPALENLVRAFKASDQGVKLMDNIRAVQWGKLLVNLNNALNTLHGGPLKSGLMQRDYRRALALVIEEALHVVRTAGEPVAAFGKASPDKTLKILRLPNSLYGLVMNFVVKIDAQARSSMLDDLEAGRACEIDYLQGAIVRLAQQTGQTAPLNAHIQERIINAFTNRRSPKMNGTDILNTLKAHKDNATK